MYTLLNLSPAASYHVRYVYIAPKKCVYSVATILRGVTEDNASCLCVQLPHVCMFIIPLSLYLNILREVCTQPVQ